MPANLDRSVPAPLAADPLPLRLALLALAWLLVAIGVIGIVLPGLPTTVFLLLASYLFARTAPRYRAWLWNHRVLGRFLHAVAGKQGMPWIAKLGTITCIWAGVGWSCYVLPFTGLAGLALHTFLLSCAVGVSVFLLAKVKTLRPTAATIAADSAPAD